MDDDETFYLPVGDPIEGKTLPIKIISDEEMEEAAYTVGCVRKEDLSPESAEMFPDNLEGPCAYGCGHTVVWRPYLPEASPKVCMQCVVDRISQEKNGVS